MGTGEIRDFTKPNPNPEEPPTTPIRRLSGVTGNQEVEIYVHEEIVTDDEKISRKFHEPEIRVRIGDKQEWEKIRYGNDQD
jgi:hypothetical protein